MAQQAYLTTQQIRQIEQAVEEVAIGTGFGTVTILIERRRVKHLQRSVSMPFVDEDQATGPPGADRPNASPRTGARSAGG